MRDFINITEQLDEGKMDPRHGDNEHAYFLGCATQWVKGKYPELWEEVKDLSFVEASERIDAVLSEAILAEGDAGRLGLSRSAYYFQLINGQLGHKPAIMKMGKDAKVYVTLEHHDGGGPEDDKIVVMSIDGILQPDDSIKL